jgi:hypothetical protein
VPVEFDRGLDSFEKSSDNLFVVILVRYDSSFAGLNRRRLHEPQTTERLLNKDMKLDTSRIQ